MNFIQSENLTTEDVMTNLNQLNLLRVTTLPASIELYQFYNIHGIAKPRTHDVWKMKVSSQNSDQIFHIRIKSTNAEWNEEIQNNIHEFMKFRDTHSRKLLIGYSNPNLPEIKFLTSTSNMKLDDDYLEAP